MSDFDPTEAERLARELAEDDERGPLGPWTATEGCCVFADGTTLIADTLCAHDGQHSIPAPWSHEQCKTNAALIARLFNNARAASEQLRAAISECSALRREIQGKETVIRNWEDLAEGYLERAQTAEDALTAQREENGRLMAIIAADARDIEGLRAAITCFCDAVDAAVRDFDRRGKGGQHVPFHGDFASAPPSVVTQLQRWARRMREARALKEFP